MSVSYSPVLSWPSIFAGSVTALAVASVLTLLGAAFGLALPSLGHVSGFTPELGAGMIAAQVVSLGLGGYIAGRLRHQWTGIHTDEAHFRDTAHGLIVWALCTFVGAVLAATILKSPMTSAVVDIAGQALSPSEAGRAANIAAQAALFMAIGSLLSAFSAAVAARIGGLQGEGLQIIST